MRNPGQLYGTGNSPDQKSSILLAPAPGKGYPAGMTQITLELEAALAELDQKSAQGLEDAVRGQILMSKKAQQEKEQIMALLEKNHPALAGCIGMFADADFERAPQGTLPPAKI